MTAARKRIGPVSKLGRVWWGESTSVSPEAFAEARRLLRGAPSDDGGSRRRPPTGSVSEAPNARGAWYAPEEIAERIRLHPSTIRRYCQAGDLVRVGVSVPGPYILAYQFGTEWRVTETEFLNFIARAEGRAV